MKIFGIGWHKTGTTTLGSCLEELGYDHYSYRREDIELLRSVANGDMEPVWKLVERHDSFSDFPFPDIYPSLFERYPHAKYILTVRDSPERWLKSISHHVFRMGLPEEMQLVYGSLGKFRPEEKKREYLERYREHNRDVRRYFEQRDAELLELCWETGDGWQQLCEFLDEPVPDTALPHDNQSGLIRDWGTYFKRFFNGGSDSDAPTSKGPSTQPSGA